MKIASMKISTMTGTLLWIWLFAGQGEAIRASSSRAIIRQSDAPEGWVLSTNSQRPVSTVVEINVPVFNQGSNSFTYSNKKPQASLEPSLTSTMAQWAPATSPYSSQQGQCCASASSSSVLAGTCKESTMAQWAPAASPYSSQGQCCASVFDNAVFDNAQYPTASNISIGNSTHHSRLPEVGHTAASIIFVINAMHSLRREVSVGVNGVAFAMSEVETTMEFLEARLGDLVKSSLYQVALSRIMSSFAEFHQMVYNLSIPEVVPQTIKKLRLVMYDTFWLLIVEALHFRQPVFELQAWTEQYFFSNIIEDIYFELKGTFKQACFQLKAWTGHNNIEDFELKGEIEQAYCQLKAYWTGQPFLKFWPVSTSKESTQVSLIDNQIAERGEPCLKVIQKVTVLSTLVLLPFLDFAGLANLLFAFLYQVVVLPLQLVCRFIIVKGNMIIQSVWHNRGDVDALLTALQATIFNLQQGLANGSTL